MRQKKVRVRLDPTLCRLLGREEVLAQIALEGSADDLLYHLEDAYPTHAAVIRTCLVAVEERVLDNDEVIPHHASVRLLTRE